MKSSVFIYIVLAAVISMTAAKGAGTPTVGKETADKARSIAEKEPGLRATFLPDEMKGTRVPLASVPDEVKRHAAKWIKRVLKADLLPADFESRLTATKDAQLHERRDSKGSIISRWTGDFLLLDFESAGYAVHIQESGYTLSFRIEAPAIEVQDKKVAQSIRGFWTRWLNAPADVVAEGRLEVTTSQPLARGAIKDPRRLKGDGTPDIAEWWEHLRVWTDGRVFYVVVTEIETGKSNLWGRPGLPDRF